MDLFERIEKIIELKRDGLGFDEIARKLKVSKKTINDSYLVGILMRDLKENGVDPSKYSYSELRKMRRKIATGKLKLEPGQFQVVPSGSKKKKNEVFIEEGFNGLSGHLRKIEKYKGLCEKIFILMRKDRIETYDIDTQKEIIKLMSACEEHLINELHAIKKSEIEIEKPFTLKSEVIEIDWEER